MKVWIVYDTKHNNNKQVAEALAGLLKEGNEVHVHYAKDISPKEVVESMPDILLFGGPLRMGKISSTINGWAGNVSKALTKKGLKVKKVGAWGTHLKEVPDMPVKWSWATAEHNWKALMEGVPAEKTMPRVQGIIVTDMKGPMESGWQDLVRQYAETIKTL